MQTLGQSGGIPLLCGSFILLGITGGCSIDTVVRDDTAGQPSPDFDPTLDLRLLTKEAAISTYDGPLKNVLT